MLATNARVALFQFKNMPEAYLPTRSRSCITFFRPFFRPCFIAFCALAIFLWGFGYKLSLYQVENLEHAPSSVAKLWIEHRTASDILAATRTRTPHRIPAAQLLPAPPHEALIPQLAPAPARTFRPIGLVLLFRAFIPLRSPPLTGLCLA